MTLRGASREHDMARLFAAFDLWGEVQPANRVCNLARVAPPTDVRREVWYVLPRCNS